MTKAEYIKAILKGTSFDRKTQKRIEADLATDIDARLEAGAGMAQVVAEMGPPAEVAANLQAELGGPPRKSRWRWLFLALAVVLAAAAVFSAIYWQLFNDTLTDLVEPLLNSQSSGRVWTSDEEADVGIIGGADGPTEIFVTSYVGFSFGGVLGTAAACLGVFLLMQWKGLTAGRRYLALGLAAIGCAVILLVGGLSGSIIEHWAGQLFPLGTAGLFLTRLINPAFWARWRWASSACGAGRRCAGGGPFKLAEKDFKGTCPLDALQRAKTPPSIRSAVFFLPLHWQSAIANTRQTHVCRNSKSF